MRTNSTLFSLLVQGLMTVWYNSRVAKERPQLFEFLTQAAATFVEMSPQLGAKRFVLKGPNDPAAVTPLVLAAVFPRELFPPNQIFLLRGKTPGVKVRSFYQPILQLEIPNTIKALAVRDDVSLRTVITRASMSVAPTCALVIGRVEDTGEETATLFAIQGVSPETALQEIKTGLRAKIAEMN